MRLSEVRDDNKARWSSGQDGGLSRLNQEFDSPTGHQRFLLTIASIRIIILLLSVFAEFNFDRNELITCPEKGGKERKLKFSLLTFFFKRKQVGVYNGEGPPVPIPNTEVKLICADDTWLETARENR